LAFRTIRFRLTAWYALTLAVVLLVSGGVWYLYLSRSLLRHVDQRLLEMTDGLPVLRMKLARAEDPCEAFSDFARCRRGGDFFRLLDQAGLPLCEPCGNRGVAPPIKPDMLAQARRQGVVLETVEYGDACSMRLMTVPVTPGEGGMFLQSGSAMCAVRGPLQAMRLLFLVVGPLALLAVAAAGWLVAGRVLAPVEKLTRAMRSINVQNLSQRLPVGRGRDEISHLAETFNAMLARLEESFRKIKQFSGDASHELRTPLTILKGETEVALRWAKQPEEFRKIFESNMEEIDRMSRIIDDLLLLAKSEGGEKPLEIRELSLSDLLQALYMQGRSLAEANGIELVLRPEVTEEVRIRGDELRLRQVFLNLISNAVKYTPKGGRVEIVLSLAGDEAVVAVSDTGIGIPEEHLPHIFDRFYRIDKARNREDGGTGLGLAIVDSFVQAHEGRITIASTPGKGSTFTVYLPVRGPQDSRPDLNAGA
jgi:heavy metal sensor kinase